MLNDGGKILRIFTMERKADSKESIQLTKYVLLSSRNHMQNQLFIINTQCVLYNLPSS